MKEIWDKKAKTFPRYKEDSKEDEFIFEYFKNKGVQFTNKNILDLGCGNGRYALHFAKFANKIHALDISIDMLKNVEEDAKNHKISNIKTYCNDWENFNVDIFEDSIDIVFASLTPALNSFTKFKKAYDLTKEYIMYIGWGRKRESEFLNEIFSAHKASVELPKGALDVAKYLKKMNKEIPEIHFITKNIHHKKSLNNAINDAIWQIEIHKITPNYNVIKEIAESWLKDDNVCYTDIMEIGIMLIKK